jgi:co-chaperonin GroES (HSP10)
MTHTPEATNNYVHIRRDEKSNESGGLIIPDSGIVKPNTGEILSVGSMVKEKKIKKGKIALWHSTVGQEIEYKGEVFLVLPDVHIIGVD